MSMNTKMNEPFLEITEQPIDKFRFRYITEMKGTHGMITGQHSKKTFPSIRLRNFNGEALIRCSLFQILKTGHGIAFPHSHSLVIRCDNENKKDPHEAMVSQLNLYKATFHGMGKSQGDTPEKLLFHQQSSLSFNGNIFTIAIQLYYYFSARPSA